VLQQLLLLVPEDRSVPDHQEQELLAQYMMAQLEAMELLLVRLLGMAPAPAQQAIYSAQVAQDMDILLVLVLLVAALVAVEHSCHQDTTQPAAVELVYLGKGQMDQQVYIVVADHHTPNQQVAVEVAEDNLVVLEVRVFIQLARVASMVVAVVVAPDVAVMVHLAHCVLYGAAVGHIQALVLQTHQLT
jgi:hypothetical protein